MTFGQRLEKQLIIKNISKTELATFLDLPLSVIQEYCSNQTEPTLDVLIAIAEKLDTTVNYLVCDSEKADDEMLSTLAELLKKPENQKIFEALIKLNKEQRNQIYEHMEQFISKRE